MAIPIRLLRACADRVTRPQLKWDPRDEDRHNLILTIATSLMADFGPHNITLRGLAAALIIAPATLKKHFPDIDCVLAEILNRHLLYLANAISAVRTGTTAPEPARRAAYLRASRGICGPTEAHLLLMRFRHILPPDLRAPIEASRAALGTLVAGANGDAALGLMDTESVNINNIEPIFAALTGAPPLYPAARVQPPRFAVHAAARLHSRADRAEMPPPKARPPPS